MSRDQALDRLNNMIRFRRAKREEHGPQYHRDEELAALEHAVMVLELDNEPPRGDLSPSVL